MTTSDHLLGYFPREAAPVPEAFTGERMTAAVGGMIEIEHYHRYLFARTFCTGRDVLDVASGEGYGSAQLAQVARSVVGVEYAHATARHARASFPHANLSFVQGDARALPLVAASVDVVVSFETIEHFPGQADFLREVRRVLRPGGLLIVSTPDRDTYAPPGAPTNPYHVREMNRREFEAILAPIFPHVRMVNQRAFVGSALLSDDAAGAAPLVFERRGDRFVASLGLPHAPYLIAVASDAPVPALPPSLYLARGDIDGDAMRAAEAMRRLEAISAELAQARAESEAQRQHAKVAEATAAAAATASAMAVAEAAAAAASVNQADAARTQARHECAALAAELAAAQAALAQAEERAAALMCDLHRLGGSARLFLRGYLHRLRQRNRGISR